jgi:hypothetical protein
MNLGHKGHLNTRNKFSEEVFFTNPTISLSILHELKKPRFWVNEEKFMKSNGLDPWIHFKVRGR